VQPPNTRSRLVATSTFAVQTRLRRKYSLEPLPAAVLTKRTGGGSSGAVASAGGAPAAVQKSNSQRSKTSCSPVSKYLRTAGTGETYCSSPVLFSSSESLLSSYLLRFFP